MSRAVFITATDTGAGKTWVTQHLLRLLLQKGEDVQALKPIASGMLPSGLNEDVDILLSEQPHKTQPMLNFHTFSNPVAPAMAAQLEQHTLDQETLALWLQQQRQQQQLTLIEGVGGLMVPLGVAGQETWLLSDWIQDIPDVDVLLVVPLRLGCMNQVLLSCSLLASLNITPICLLFNDIDQQGEAEKTMALLKPCLSRIFDTLPPLIAVQHRQDLSQLYPILETR
ncbi:MAG: dethiobiotin synthase [Mariprofundaceae bacterium]|nr:dethiobiotin synthase [Mariprofundaceae bacterium]